MTDFQLRAMNARDRDGVTALIHASTNRWYAAHGHGKILGGDPKNTAVFFDVYQALDGDCGVIAERNGQIVGSCFYHPRSTHMSLGIMNVHPDHFGSGIGRAMLRYILDLADASDLSVRLVSSAMNLDSFSLYTRAGFVPRYVYQDMALNVPDTGLRIDPCVQNELEAVGVVRDAGLDDAGAMAALEMEVAGIDREGDFRYFIDNPPGFWHVSVCEDRQGRLQGFIASSGHQRCNLVGPGVARSQAAAAALLIHELDLHRGRTPVFLIPVEASDLVSWMYRLGARNCELHFGQVRGSFQPMRGINMPTFLPETA